MIKTKHQVQLKASPEVPTYPNRTCSFSRLLIIWRRSVNWIEQWCPRRYSPVREAKERGELRESDNCIYSQWEEQRNQSSRWIGGHSDQRGSRMNPGIYEPLTPHFVWFIARGICSLHCTFFKGVYEHIEIIQVIPMNPGKTDQRDWVW